MYYIALDTLQKPSISSPAETYPCFVGVSVP